MPGMPRRGKGRRLWDREAVRFRRAALGCYAAALPLAGLTLGWSRVAWLAVGAALLAGLWCERTAIFARRLGDDTRDEADVPGD